MFIANGIQNIVSAGTEQLILWVTQVLPQVFLFLILLNAVTRMIGRARVERLALRCGSNPILRYMVLPFLSAVVLGNPMAISMGRYLPEEHKPAFFASVSYHCHTSNGIFQHINPAELFIWLGIANGVLARGLNIFPLAFRYMCAGLIANFISGYVTELFTRKLEKKEHIHLSTHVHLQESPADPEGAAQASPERKAENADISASSAASPNGNATVAGNDSGSKPDNDSGSKPGNNSGSKPRNDSGNNSGNNPGDELSPWHTITISRGDGGYGGPLTITPTKDRHIVLYMTAAGLEPEPLEKIVALSGMKAVDGNQETVPDEEVALAIIDCGGTLRCGIYPGKGIPTVNLLTTGRSGPLAKYMTEDLYVSAVTSAEITSADAASAETAAEITSAAAASAETVAEITSADAASAETAAEPTSADAASAETAAEPTSADAASAESLSAGAEISMMHRLHKWLLPVAAISKAVSIFHQSARDAFKTCLEIILPFMGFAALFIGICRGSGLTEFIAGLIGPMGGSLPGLFITGIICSIPGLSAILGAGAVAAQMFATVIGDLIQSGSIAPAMALPALFAINCQCACDFIPVGLGMMEAKPRTMQLGITSVTLSRFATGWLRILIALVFSIGLYK